MDNKFTLLVGCVALRMALTRQRYVDSDPAHWLINLSGPLLALLGAAGDFRTGRSLTCDFLGLPLVGQEGGCAGEGIGEGAEGAG